MSRPTISTSEDSDDLLSLVTGGDLEDTIPDVVDASIRLIDGKRYGHVVLYKDDHIPSQGVVHYKCKCDCGNSVYLSRHEIHTRHRMRAGCFAYECNYGPLEAKAWHNARFALKLQLSVLIKRSPEEVDPAWGGRAYGTKRNATAEEGFEQFYQDVLPHVVECRRVWWLARKNYLLPYSAFNIELRSSPAFDVFEGGARYIMLKDSLCTLREAAAVFRVNLLVLKQMRRAIIEDELLVHKLMEGVEPWI